MRVDKKWSAIEPPLRAHLEMLASHGATNLQAWYLLVGGEELRAIVSREPIGPGPDGAPDWRWHLSISHADRIPSWEEYVAVIHDLRPGVVFCQAIPPRDSWINLHSNVLHAFEIKDPNLLRLWKIAPGTGQEPS